ncbi:MAG: phosphatase PAP2 family protein [Candidatus Neomarinimicrobiota bacterium]|jgi:membrane-associated phospholipid phosphatase|nr:phosphatase PAP2 family protein [Candidatus Neomarinimicrobiota bacterium]MDX9779828.1 phosphatase PAP2 family protein [bacterium]
MKKIIIFLIAFSIAAAQSTALSNADYFRTALPEVAKTWQGYVVLGSGAASAGLASFADKPIREWMTRQQYLPPVLDKIGDHYVDHYWCFGVSALGALGKGLQTGNYLESFRYWAFSNVTTVGITYVLKYSIHRERPNGRNRYSFPSGHSSSAFATATMLQMWYGWPAGIPAYALAALTAFQRMDDNQHWLSDVIMGTAIGIAVPYMFYRGEEKAKLQNTPLFIPPIAVSIPLHFPVKK